VIDYKLPGVSWWPHADGYFCRFKDLVDPESGVVAYSTVLRVQRRDGTTASVGPVTGTVPWVTFHNLNAQQLDVMRCEVTAINGAGVNATFRSTGATADLTPPICTAWPVTKESVRYNEALKAVRSDSRSMLVDASLVRASEASDGIAFVFSCYDDESGVTDISVGLGFEAGDDSARAFAPVALPSGEGGRALGALVLSLADLAAASQAGAQFGAPYRLTVRARNRAGVRRSVTSTRVIMDGTAPVPVEGWPFDSAIIDGPDASSRPIRWSAVPEYTTALFQLVDEESALASVSVAVVAMPGGPAQLDALRKELPLAPANGALQLVLERSPLHSAAFLLTQET
jgi:hypothetical protein